MSIPPIKPLQNPPLLPPKVEYSKLKLVTLFLSFIPVFLTWTALSLSAWPLLKIASCLRAKWHWANSLMNECFNLWIAIARYFLTVKPVGGKGQPILLVHGYLHNSSGWYVAAEELEKGGLGPVYTIDLGDGTIGGKFWSIRNYAEQVAVKVKEIQEATGCQEIALVGHSMGGIVSALYAVDAPPGLVSDVIAIGSPFHGTCFSHYFGVGPDGEEMRTDSELLEELRNKIEDTPGIRFHSIASSTDEIVPLDSALIGEDPMIVEDKGHFSLMISRKVAQQVVRWLQIPL